MTAGTPTSCDEGEVDQGAVRGILRSNAMSIASHNLSFRSKLHSPTSTPVLHSRVCCAGRAMLT